MSTRTIARWATLWLVAGLTVACAGPAGSVSPAVLPIATSASTPTVNPPTYVHPYMTSVAVVSLDYQSRRLKDVYVSYHEPCNVGLFSPSVADWVIFVHRDPTGSY